MTNQSTMLSRSGPKVEIRFEAEGSEFSVLDGYCSAHGRSRTAVFREVLKEWSDKQGHIASVICRVAGINPYQPDTNRKDSGSEEQ